jgi:hypothetical protein
VLLGGITCLYSTASRHAVAARDACFAELCAAHESAVAELHTRFQRAAEEAERWRALWEDRVRALQEGV